MAEKQIEHQRLIESSQEDTVDLPKITARHRTRIQFLAIVIVLSTALNLVLASFLMNSRCSSGLSQYADLTWSLSSTWGNVSRFMDRHHKTKTDQAWDSIDFSNGMIAINDEEVEELGLPRSQRFPWDDSKGIYLVNAYHNLHCLKWLWRSLAKFRDGGEFDNVDWHGFHCLDSLRQDTICYADDTPRYTGEGQDNETSGFRQNRQCRDWSKLEQWARERSSCYRFLGNEVEDTLDRHKFCPDGSPYIEVLADIYGPHERERLLEVYGDRAA